jgi:hypothetical protein
VDIITTAGFQIVCKMWLHGTVIYWFSESNMAEKEVGITCLRKRFEVKSVKIQLSNLISGLVGRPRHISFPMRRVMHAINQLFFVIPFDLQSVRVHSAKCVKLKVVSCPIDL